MVAGWRRQSARSTPWQPAAVEVLQPLALHPKARPVRLLSVAQGTQGVAAAQHASHADAVLA